MKTIFLLLLAFTGITAAKAQSAERSTAVPAKQALFPDFKKDEAKLQVKSALRPEMAFRSPEDVMKSIFTGGMRPAAVKPAAARAAAATAVKPLPSDKPLSEIEAEDKALREQIKKTIVPATDQLKPQN